jgi:5-aminolevulinate synthase
MNYEAFFTAAVNRLKDEQRYRVFVDLERIAGRFSTRYLDRQPP